MARKFITSFIRCPLPTGPMCLIVAAQHSMIGVTLAIVSASPPSMASTVPSSASFGVRPRGASTRAMPLASNASDNSTVEAGKEVDVSITTSPGFAFSRMPPGPVICASTCALLARHRWITSQCSTISATDAASRAPLPISESTGIRFRFPLIQRS